MKNYIFFFLIILIPVILKIVLELSKKENKFPYAKKKYFLTPTEQQFYLILVEWFQDKYYIFPQIHISSLIEVTDSEKKQHTYLNKIDRKSIDFVLFDKLSMLPVLAIELDDYTHLRLDRVERDKFVDKVFEITKLPILHIKNIKDQNIKENIDRILFNETGKIGS